MKAYKKLMDMLAFAEEVVLVLSTAVILVLTVGNVFSRKVIHQSWSFTEELVPKPVQKPLMLVNTVLCICFTGVLFRYGMDKVLTQMANGKRTFVLNWPEWIFWSFVPIGAVCMILHFVEFFLDFCQNKNDEKEDN